MDDAVTNAESRLMERLRVAVWSAVGIAFVAIVGAIAVLAFQYAQVVKAPNPGDAGLVRTVKVDDFLKQFPQAPSLPGTAGGKYLEEARQIVACSRDSNARSGMDTAGLTPQLAEAFRLELQRVAETRRDDRGAAYAVDAVRFYCAVLNQPAVIEYKKSNSEEQLFDAVINFHLAQWDQLKDEARRLRQDDQLRNLNATIKEDLRVARAQSGALAALSIVGVSLGLLVAAVLYFVLTRMQMKLNDLSRMVEALNDAVAQRSEPKVSAEVPAQSEPIALPETSSTDAPPASA